MTVRPDSREAPAALLIDLDGVLYQDGHAIEGATRCLDWVRATGVPHLYLTNTTSRPRDAIRAQLAALGMPVHTESIMTPVVAAAHWLSEQQLGPAAVFVHESTQTDFAGIELLPAGAESGAAAVVIGDLGTAWDFATLNRAFRLLMEPGQPQLIALGTTRYWRAADGLRLDVGPFVAALEQATGRRALVVGKPDRAFFHQAAALVGCRAGGCVMIGDDIRGDVGGAQAAGMRGLLVRTGKFGPADLDSGIQPDAVLDSIKDLPRWWTGNGARGRLSSPVARAL